MKFFRYSLCAILSVCSIHMVQAMDTSIGSLGQPEPTPEEVYARIHVSGYVPHTNHNGTGNIPGKYAYDDKWRGNISPNDNTPYTKQDVINYLFGSGKLSSDKIKTYIKSGEIYLNVPLLGIGQDGVRGHFDFYYLVEYTIKQICLTQSKGSVERLINILQIFFQLGAVVDGYRDYSPLRDVLERLSDPDLAVGVSDGKTSKGKKEFTQRSLLICLDTLLEYGVDIHKPFPKHNGFGVDNSQFVGCTAKDFLDQTKNPWTDADLLRQVKMKFDAYESRHTVTSTSKYVRNVRSVISHLDPVDPVEPKKIQVKSQPVLTQPVAQGVHGAIPQFGGQAGPQSEQKFARSTTCSVAALAALLAAGYTAYRYWWQQTDDEDTRKFDHERADSTDEHSVVT